MGRESLANYKEPGTWKPGPGASLLLVLNSKHSTDAELPEQGTVEGSGVRREPHKYMPGGEDEGQRRP